MYKNLCISFIFLNGEDILEITKTRCKRVK
jgi:hypothetical protein